MGTGAESRLSGLRPDMGGGGGVFEALGSVEVADVESVAPRIITSPDLTLSWDWSWDIVPVARTEVTVSVWSELKGKTLRSATFTREQQTSVTWENLFTGKEDDRVKLMLVFSGPGAAPLTNSVTHYVLKGAFGAAKIRSVSTDSQRWRNYSYPLVFPYDAEWFGAPADKPLTVALKDRNSDAAELSFPQGQTQGLAFLGLHKGDLPRTDWQATVVSDKRYATAQLDYQPCGMVIFVK